MVDTPAPRRHQTSGPRRTWSDRSDEADLEQRRVALPKMFFFLLFGWLAFTPSDLYIAVILAPKSPRAWMLLWRCLGAIFPLAGWLTARGRQTVSRTSDALELVSFGVLTFCLAMMAIGYGGLDSHIIPGISLLMTIQVVAVPSRWRRMLPRVLATYAVYPLTMAAAATVRPGIAAQWRSHDALVFVLDYAMVAAVAVGGVIGGHVIWGTRRQLYYARRLGRYRLKARIGHGGSSEVWLAWDDALRRDVALKILDRSASTDRVAIARFEREALAASGLQSPHTIRVFDFGASDDGVWFMAMEHLEGVDLAMLVDEVGPLPVDRAVRFARQACLALSEAHDSGVVHRDIKPDNLFVCRVGEEADFLKVLDFGIAKIAGADEDVSVTRAGWVHGTPAYMSPEACNGAGVDPRSDVYSLGAVLYFLLTGTPPFTAPTAAAVMLAHVSEIAEPPSSRVLVPPDLEVVVMRCLEKEPDARYASARDLEAALLACCDLMTTREPIVASGATMSAAIARRANAVRADKEPTPAAPGATSSPSAPSRSVKVR